MPAGIVISAVGLGISLYQGVKAGIDRKKAKEEIESYERQDYKNPYLSLDKYPTQAIELQKEANERELATNVAIASKSGRGLSIMPQASAVYGRRTKEIAGEIEKYQYEREKLVADGEVLRQDAQEKREEGDIAGIGNLYATASQDMNNAIVGAGNALAIGVEAYGANGNSFGFGNKDKTITPPPPKPNYGDVSTGSGIDYNSKPYS